MLVLLVILIYQTWTCPSLPFVKDQTMCESCSWTFPFLFLVTAAVLAVPVAVAAASAVGAVVASVALAVDGGSSSVDGGSGRGVGSGGLQQSWQH